VSSYYYRIKEENEECIPSLREWTEFWCFKGMHEAVDLAIQLVAQRFKAGEFKTKMFHIPSQERGTKLVLQVNSPNFGEHPTGVPTKIHVLELEMWAKSPTELVV
jgi:hypothetical protein